LLKEQQKKEGVKKSKISSKIAPDEDEDPLLFIGVPDH